MRKLSKAQAETLDVIKSKGALFPGNGVSIRTVRALESAGLITLEFSTSRRQNPRTLIDTNHWDVDWVARPVTAQ